MTSAQIEAFLREDRHAVLATTRRNGTPQLTPVWFLYEDGQLYISAGASTAKVHNLRRDPRTSVCVDGCRGDERYVILSGTATLVEPGEPLQQETRWRIIRKYHDSDGAAQRYYDSIKDSPAALIIVSPDKILSGDFT
jgi:PPOX class probable F420-dependent enzyme